MFPVNQVFALDQLRYRLLWAEKEYGFWIDIDSKLAWPELVQILELERMLINQELQSIEDPFIDFILFEVTPDSVYWQKREKAWLMLKGEIGSELFDRTYRGKAVQRIKERFGVTHQTVNRLLRRYWQRGMTKNALLPDYHLSGGKGKAREPKSQKLGRPRTVTKGIGSNITPDIARIFRQIVEAKLLKQNQVSVPDAHASALNLIRACNPTKNAFELPTVEQFRYFYQREYRLVDVIEQQASLIELEKDINPILSTSTAETLGPGYRYQIDATIADVYLLSEHEPGKIVGRPVVYVVADVFSRMIVGLYVGFEGPSWVSAMMALANTIDNKVEYCAEYGVEITADQWPVRGLPEVLLADKGELKGCKVETFSEAFGVRIENAKARRGDAKGIVERYFRTLQEKFKPYTPGIVEPVISKKRGGKDYRQDATLTLPQFTELMLNSILWNNNRKKIKGYDRCVGMPSNLPAISRELWNWGLSNLTGRLRTAPMELVKINLLPHEQATTSDLGIHLYGCFFTCPEAIKLGWFHRKKGRRPMKVVVAYDPRTTNQIYLRPSNNLKEFWVCNLSDRSRRFSNQSFWDVWATRREENKADTNAQRESALYRGELIAETEAIVDSATRAKPKISGAARTKLGGLIRQNKMSEKQAERTSSAFHIGKSTRDQGADVVPIHQEPVQDYSYPDLDSLMFEEDDDDK